MKDKTATEWNESVIKGLEWRKKHSREDAWDRVAKYYEHRFEKPLDPHFNLIYMMASSWIPSLIFQSPSIINSARRPQFIYWAQFFDGIDNWLVEEMEVRDVFEEVVLFAFLYNTVGVEIGYDFPKTSIMDEKGLMSFAAVEGATDRSRKYNQPWLDIIPPAKLILAPGTRTMKNCPWYAKEVWVRTENLKEMKNLKNVYATHNLPQKNEKGEPSEEVGFTKLYIIHEQEKKTWCWLNAAGEFVLSPEEDPLQIDGLPLEVITFNRGTQSIWGTPDSLYIETQQVEGDECRKDGRLQRKTALVKAFYDAGVLDEEDLETFLTSSAMGCIPVDVPEGKSLNDTLMLVQPHVQGEYFTYQREILNDAQLISGTGPNQMGTFASGRKTKYETQVVEDRNFLRASIRRAKIADSIQGCFRRINQYIIKHWKAPLVTKVVGADAAIYWVQARPSEFTELAAELSTRVNVESLAPVSRERRRGEMLEVLKSMAGIQGINIMPIVQQFLSMFEWNDVMKTLPQVEQMAPMSMGDFQQKQQGMMSSPNLANTAKGNLGQMMGMVNKLPSAGGTNNE